MESLEKSTNSEFVEANIPITSEHCTENSRNYFGLPSAAQVQCLSKESPVILDKITEENSTKDEFSGVSKAEKKDNSGTSWLGNSLGLIAAAYSDSDTEDGDSTDGGCEVVDEKIAIVNQVKDNYRNKASSDEGESEDESSSSCSSSSDSSSETENEDDHSYDEGSKQNRKKRGPKWEEKREYDHLPPIEDLHISVPEVLCDPLGEVGWMVEQMVIVTPKANKPTLDLNTVLFVEKGHRVLGHIFDVFGQVSEPHYCVRFNNPDHIKEKNIKVGMTVYYCPNSPYTSVVFMTDLLKMKASDDVGEDEHPEFSDDEEEKAYYLSLKQKQSNISNGANPTDSNSEVPRKRSKTNPSRSWRLPHPWNRIARNQHQTIQRPTMPPSNFYSSSSWRSPIDYSRLMTPVYSYGPGFSYSPNPRPYYSPQGFESSAYSNQQTQGNYLWQQQTMPNNNWCNPPVLPPAPPPPPAK